MVHWWVYHGLPAYREQVVVEPMWPLILPDEFLLKAALPLCQAFGACWDYDSIVSRALMARMPCGSVLIGFVVHNCLILTCDSGALERCLEAGGSERRAGNHHPVALQSRFENVAEDQRLITHLCETTQLDSIRLHQITARN